MNSVMQLCVGVSECVCVSVCVTNLQVSKEMKL